VVATEYRKISGEEGDIGGCYLGENVIKGKRKWGKWEI
jgi:hypothetical protein